MSEHMVALFAFEEFQLLDVTGPASVYGVANNLLGKSVYVPIIVSAHGGAIRSSCGVALESRAVSVLPSRRIKTLLVAGGSNLAMQKVVDDPLARRWITHAARTVQRFGSICSGTYLLAALGLLGNARVATHWASCEGLARQFPALSVDPQSMFVVDGRIWTSAGVSTGIDMALAMVEHDCGRALADRIAKFMVLYLRRPGYQSQFSEILKTQTSGATDIGELAGWIQANLARQLDVPSLAAKVGLSDRTFHRRFVQATGLTPAKFVETARLEAAKAMLQSALPLKSIAARTGLGSAARLTQAFERRYGVSPAVFRKIHHGARAAS